MLRLTTSASILCLQVGSWTFLFLLTTLSMAVIFTSFAPIPDTILKCSSYLCTSDITVTYTTLKCDIGWFCEQSLTVDVFFSANQPSLRPAHEVCHPSIVHIQLNGDLWTLCTVARIQAVEYNIQGSSNKSTKPSSALNTDSQGLKLLNVGNAKLCL